MTVQNMWPNAIMLTLAMYANTRREYLPMRPATRALSIFIALFLLVLAPHAALAATPQDWSSDHPELLEEGHLFAEGAIVMDEETGEVLFSKNPDARMFPASTTKIMTLMLALESGISLDTMVTIPKETATYLPEGSSTVPLSVGEQMTFQDLLYGLMLRSGNDAAIAIAVIVSGSLDNFVALMNQRANELGCENTHFANPHGFHDDNHYTTARDLATIAREAMNNATFRKIVSTYQYTMAKTSKRGKLVIESKVELLNPDSQYYYEGCVGIKTGYHSKAGQCLVGAAEKGGRILITVALHATVDYSDRKWYDTARMFSYGFTRFDTYTVKDMFTLAGDPVNSIQVENAAADDLYGGKLGLILSQTSDDGFSVMSLKDSAEAESHLQYFKENAVVTLTTDYLEKVEERQTVEAGSIVGTLSFVAETGETITGTLIASRSVEMAPIKVSAWDYLVERIPWIESVRDERVIYAVIGVVVLILFLILLSAIRSVRRNRRRKRIYEQRRRAYYERMRRQSVDPYDMPAARPARKKGPRYDDF